MLNPGIKAASREASKEVVIPGGVKELLIYKRRLGHLTAVIVSQQLNGF